MPSDILIQLLEISMAPKMRMTQVTSITELSPHMRRIVIESDSLSDFPTGKESAHVKAIFPNPDSASKQPKLGNYFGFKKWMRSYTVRHFNQDTCQLTLDFAINDHVGLASNWAKNANVGDFLGIAGPGDTKHTDMHADRHLFVGDLTALPAIAATLENLPRLATGKAIIQIPSELDIQDIRAPLGIELLWLVTPNKLTEKFVQTLQQESTDLTNTAIFIAAEAGIVKQLKSHLNTHCRYDRSKLYASAYWNLRR